MTMEKIKVVADFDWLENEETIGLLGHESQRGTDVYTFEYDKDWLKRHPSLNLGKELQSFPGVQYNPTRNRIFGTFSDALPDRWGRRLIDLRIHGVIGNVVGEVAVAGIFQSHPVAGGLLL